MKLIDVRKIHQGKFLSYYVASYINKDGDLKEYEFISRKNNVTKDIFGQVVVEGVGLVPLSENHQRILLQKEFRLATNRDVYNFPAGLIDKGETPQEAAKRELKEETGLDLIEIIETLSPSYASQGTSDELMQIVVCTCEGEIKESCYADEEITARWYTKEEIKELLKQNVFMSARTQMFLWQWCNSEKVA